MLIQVSFWGICVRVAGVNADVRRALVLVMDRYPFPQRSSYPPVEPSVDLHRRSARRNLLTAQCIQKQGQRAAGDGAVLAAGDGAVGDGAVGWCSSSMV